MPQYPISAVVGKNSSTGALAPATLDAANNVVTGIGQNVYFSAAVNATPQAVKTSAGNCFGITVSNPGSSAAYLQVLPTATPTLGTTAPYASILVNASATVNLIFGFAIPAAGLSIAGTTTATGSTAPATALVSSVSYS